MEIKEYQNLFLEVKQVVKQSQTTAITKVNQELLNLYYQIGKIILEKQKQKGWGAKVIDTLSKDLLTDFPTIKGFSVRNLKNMRKFAEAYPNFLIVQTVSAQLSWSHHVLLLNTFSEERIRTWYINKSAQEGWSYRVLQHQIKLEVHKSFGSLPNNFDTHFSNSEAESITQLFKDEYIFDFISQNDKMKEKDLESELVKNITDFLLSLGKGFSYIGKQYHLEIGNQDFYIDLLFYHYKLKCFVVVELKIDDFKPEYVGKLNFYLSAVDDLLKQKEDLPSIGLLLCSSKNNTIVEYALRDVSKPMGVVSYSVSKKIPDNLKDSLPTEKELKSILKRNFK
ncbi:PDDEXK nuclease domain-containing protein [Bernardetia sp. ABR2-2B]|uniref:PDDEXK nuclease domain-containing protein n=1 Tax=Bernardetia sp. ABR2-2B TaxID=3127472 RepID=UPI0030D48CD8